MIGSEYRRFLQWMDVDKEGADVCKVANLILRHLDDLAPLSRAQSQRIKKIVELAQASWEELPTTIEANVEEDDSSIRKIERLTSLRVGPFRGFSDEEVFDLDGRYVLIYGPNGTGKSSFCEALEYSLLGSVAEAESKRFTNQNNYFKNIHANCFSEPVLQAVHKDGEVGPVQADEAAHRFFFIEKNRIDGFSRIAAQTPAKQGEMVSTLFGLDDFADFVGKFPPEISEKNIDLKGAKATQLQGLRQQLASSEETVKAGPKVMNELEVNEYKLALEYREGCSYGTMVTELIGNEDSVGLIESLDKEMSEPFPSKTGVTVGGLTDAHKAVSNTDSLLEEKKHELAKAGADVSFKKLYEAVSALGDGELTECPACKTPADRWSYNPVEVASEELGRLGELAAIQQTISELTKQREEAIGCLRRSIEVCSKKTGNELWLQMGRRDGAEVHDVAWWRSLRDPLESGESAWDQILMVSKRLEREDGAIAIREAERPSKRKKLEEWRSIESKITTLQERRRLESEKIASAQKRIKAFEKDNAELIGEVEDEKDAITRNQCIVDAYTAFVTALTAYKDGLPAILVRNLSETVVALYNAFNAADPEQDKLSSVHLPLGQNEKLLVSFNRAPDEAHDALLVLSEGHIRCLGLAILAAKNLKEECPVIIFDDPVNAIDDDHKECIRRVLFDDTRFSGKQIILACHGEEFFKDIQNVLPASEASRAKRLSFLPRLGDNGLRIDHNSQSRNYVISSREHYDKGEVRRSLADARQALEMLTKDKLWRLLSKHGDGNLSIKLRGPKEAIGLRNLTEQLKKGFTMGGCDAPNGETVVESLSKLLGLSGDSREWRYLNKGTHEESDREEFDRVAVSDILTALEGLEAAVS